MTCKTKRNFKMANVFGLSKWKKKVAMKCDKGEMGGVGLAGKMMDMVLYVSSLGCLLDILMEIRSSKLAYELEFIGEVQDGDPKLRFVIIEDLFRAMRLE